MRPLTRLLIFLAAAASITVLLGIGQRADPSFFPSFSPSSQGNDYGPPQAAFSPPSFYPASQRGNADEACIHWNPHGFPDEDPPDCLRARQFRQIQHVRENNHDFEKVNYPMLDRLEKCVLGQLACPQRPLIVANWWYAFNGVQGGVSGEELWMGWVADVLKDEGFVYMPTNNEPHALWLTKYLSESLHMYWGQDIRMVDCITNPRCVRPEDFTPHPDPSIGHKVENLSKEDYGKIPLWKIFTTSYWGARPHDVGGPGQNSWHDWRQREEPYSYNPLGQNWILTPFPYVNHSYMPYSIERQCLQTQPIRHEERNNSVLILSKRSAYFKWENLNEKMGESWDYLVSQLEAHGHEYWTTAEDEPGYPIPDGLVRMGKMPRKEYESMVGHAKVLLGIGKPEISPSVYTALCRGLPLVMPYKGEEPVPEGWMLYHVQHAQHGPANTLGEPWVYTYDIDDVEDMMAKIKKAIDNPIEPYVPPDMTEVGARENLRKIIYHDWEREYRKILADNGGVVPSLPDAMVERCFETGNCKPDEADS